MYKRNPYKKLQTKNESFLNVTSLRNRDSPKAGVSCLIHQVRSTFYFCCLGFEEYLDREARRAISAAM